MSLSKNKKGFTLIELIIVIAIIAILAAAVFVALDPARRLNESRNARRASDVTNVLDAVVKCQTDNEGVQCGDVANLSAGEFIRVGTGSNCSTEATGALACSETAVEDCADLTTLGSNYLGQVPVDPGSARTAADTGYYIGIDANNAVTVGACDEEAEGQGGAGDVPVIELTR